jgi:addiction module RelE/StbE family toxin
VNFVLLRSNIFIRNARKIVKKQAFFSSKYPRNFSFIIRKISFQPRLRTHKLKGELKDSYACSVGYDLRIVFKFVEYEQKQAILLESIGTHDQVY